MGTTPDDFSLPGGSLAAGSKRRGRALARGVGAGLCGEFLAIFLDRVARGQPADTCN